MVPNQISNNVNSELHGIGIGIVHRPRTVVEMKSIFFKKACKFNEGPKKIPF